VSVRKGIGAQRLTPEQAAYPFPNQLLRSWYTPQATSGLSWGHGQFKAPVSNACEA
jgi:hypothetical protein